jgi:hypothetical protein
VAERDKKEKNEKEGVIAPIVYLSYEGWFLASFWG